MKFYRTSNYSNTIQEEKEFIRETDASLFSLNKRGKEERELKASNYATWHKSKEDALEYLHKRIDSNINFKKQELKELETDLSAIIHEQLSQ